MTTPQTAGAPGDGHPAARHTIVACFLGYMLNAMDVQIFDPAMLAMMKSPDAFEVTKAGAVLVGTATLLTSAVGGWLAGWMSDRFGRVRTLQVMIVWFAVFTFLCGRATDFRWLFVMRALMGIGFGGQWAAAAVMVGEAFGKAHRGKAVGFMQTGWAVGWGIAFFGLPALLPSILPPDVSVWRALFWAGGLLPVLLLIPYVHWFVRESPVFDLTRRHLADAGKTADSVEIFSHKMLWTTFWTCMLSIGAMGGYYTIQLWLPAFLAEHELTIDECYLKWLIAGSGAGYLVSALLSDLGRFGWRANFGLFAICAIVLCLPTLLAEHKLTVTGWYLAILIAGLGAGYLASALFSALRDALFPDRNFPGFFGRRRNFVFFAIFAIATVFACICFADDKIILAPEVRRSIILRLAFPLGFFASGTFAGTGAFFTELFPTRMRGTGVGISYNFGRGFAVLILWLIPWVAGTGWVQGLSSSLPQWLSTTPLGLTTGVFVLIAYLLVVIAALLLPETKGTVLDTDVGEAQEIVPAHADPLPARGV